MCTTGFAARARARAQARDTRCLCSGLGAGWIADYGWRRRWRGKIRTSMIFHSSSSPVRIFDFYFGGTTNFILFYFYFGGGNKFWLFNTREKGNRSLIQFNFLFFVAICVCVVSV